MKEEKRTALNVILIAIISIVTMFIVEYYIVPGYIVKSILKVFMFFMLPLIYIGYDERINILDYFKIESKRQFFGSLALGISIYMLILGSYFILTTYIDLSEIREILYKSGDITKKNFFYVAVYISFLNSLLEEFFFRGFLFLSVNKMGLRIPAYFLSALGFSLYHIGIMVDWFNIMIFLLAIIALFIGGLIFNYLNEDNKNIYNSWLVHVFANLALNTIGLIMYGFM